MMKQFLRVKQIADQKFQRGDKSRVLTDELTAAEKRVDLIKESCCATGKKLSACMQRLTPDQSSDKNRTCPKKIPEAALAQCMEEWGLSLGENSILGLTLVDYAGIQEALAADLLNYKLQVEENVVEPLQNILNVDINKIIKLRKQLFKLTSEMEAAKTRFQSAQRSSQQATGNAAVTASAKAQLLKEETEDIVSRVDQCRDSLTAEMFNLISREPEMSQVFVKLCQLQLEHHRKAFYMLESALPELEAQIKSCAYQPVFGVTLEQHLKVSKREIAIVIESCICWLLESAMEEEGLFRIGGSMIKIKKMKSAFDAGFHHLLEEERDPHNVAGILKLYLRSLPEPLLTYHLYDLWMEAAMEPDHDARLKSLWSIVNSLPETHFKNLRYLIKFLSKLCQNSDVNKMSIQNVAIVIGPNLIWPHVEECALGMNMTATNLHSSIVDTLIMYADWFFPGDCEFYVSTPTSPRHIEGFPSPSSLYGSQLSLSTARLSNGDSAVDSMSSSPSNSSPKSPSPRAPIRPRKKAAPRAPESTKNLITRSVSYSGFQANALARANASVHAANLSASHENLLNAGYNGEGIGHDKQVEKNGNLDLQQTRPPVVERRPKPPRQNRNGLPPVAERSRKSVGRPSVPPPERPDSFSKSESVSSASPELPEVFSYDEKVLDPEDISISFDSSESESYNECQMSFMDDSDNECDNKMDDANYSSKTNGANYRNGTTDYSNSMTTEGNAEDKIVVSSEDDTRGSWKTATSYTNAKTTSSGMKAGDTSEDYRVAGIEESAKSITVANYTNGKTTASTPTSGNPEHKTREFIEDGKKGNLKTPKNSNGSAKNISHKQVEGHCNGTKETTNVHPELEEVQLRSGGVLKIKTSDGLSNGTQVKKPVRSHISWEDHKNRNFDSDEKFDSSTTCDENEENAYSCHFTGGTPTWFDHYGDDKRQSNTLWFKNDNDINCEEGNNRRSALPSIEEDGESYRTVIEIGNENKTSYRSTVSGMAIKLRVNSESQDTRL